MSVGVQNQGASEGKLSLRDSRDLRSSRENTRAAVWAAIERNGFILAMLLAVALAFLFPAPGARGGWMHADILNNLGVALILFVQGLGMAVERMKAGLRNWPLHLIIQGFTFLVFPLIGLGWYAGSQNFWPGEPPGLRNGFLYLCVLPSTVSTSVVLTNVAKGNTSAAIFNAALSNIMGVALTPILVHLLMQSSGQTGPLGSLMIKVTLLTLLPFLVGMSLRPAVRELVDANRRWLNRVSNAVILFIVYTAFCDSVKARTWVTYGIGVTAEVLGGVALLFATVAGLVWALSEATRLNRADRIAALFCSVKKTLAMGVPLARLIFGPSADLGLILLPIMFYHPFQLFVCGLLANRFAQGKSHDVDRKNRS
jgi:solute carrier family 10 (sodium/bile acid cotransporter), member 7